MLRIAGAGTVKKLEERIYGIALAVRASSMSAGTGKDKNYHLR